MQKYTLVFRLSFIGYLLAALARPYITAQTWADIILMLFLGCCAYQLLYILFFRRKDGAGFLRSIARLFLYTTFVLYLYTFLFYAFDVGYHMGLEFLIYIPLNILCLVYQALYVAIDGKMKKGRE